MCCACGSKNDLQEPSAACTHLYCMGCLVGMFRFAVKDRSSFPVHCCGLIQLHTVLPTLDESAAKAYRAIWDEWMTAKKVYCPERSCSVFIPPRLIPHSVDADTAPADISFPCPTCKTGICAKCCRLVHRGEPCGEAENDYELALLATFGYKPCPRCGEGVKRMFGCRHVRCRCGADFCWACLSPKKDCNGDCVAHESEEGSEPEQNSEGSENGDADDDLVQSPKEPANLDLNTQAHWENSGLDFGDDPGDTRMPQIWSCVHQFDEFMAADGEELRHVSPLRFTRFRPADIRSVDTWSAIVASRRAPVGAAL
ncbi:uncharacterized protein MYCGRDRAFT_71864 [Zymoseptoria tritici IPO323]|uniref:RING-type domain-containing protein n=1 Tax=Zymoseptoria tritici (strain CBS 115943 / IPO323) TaxID=336722 RepID=F9XB94_ZYMTI|nr:uncharacterized protein MYCGRDRAFT_71864 [Zymoseptoria tritici IPO323]EGP87689.1 hypothetical protein MYCGRDRAFT_71864 [Zymoseptoria tritici IPO323]